MATPSLDIYQRCAAVPCTPPLHTAVTTLIDSNLIKKKLMLNTTGKGLGGSSGRLRRRGARWPLRGQLPLPCNFSPHSAISAADMCCDAAISACHTPLVFYIVFEQAVDSAEISALQAEISASHRMIGCNFSFSICVLIIRLRQHPLEISACCLLQRCLPSGCPACCPAGSPQARSFSRSGGPPVISARTPVVCAARRPPCDAFR